MRNTLCILAFCLVTIVSVDVNAAAQKLDVKPNQAVFKDAKRNAPIEIKTADGLAKYFDKKQVAAITKQVDFKREVMLIFAWRGSGQDELQYTILKSMPPQLVFRVIPGRTRDLRPHVHVYAVPTDVRWSMSK